MTDLSLVAENIHITYRTYLDPQVGIRTRLKSARGTARRRHVDVNAVRGVSFDLHKGESLGIIGHNGAGKSTILLGLAGLLELNEGRILSRSRPTLLGVGAVLDNNLSGRRNIEIGCLAQGMSKDEVVAKMDEVVDFSGLEEFIDLPLKTYSSGMKARLTFTVATMAKPEILLIDEALAVGDIDFRAKATKRLEEIRAGAGSVIVVSHNTREVARMCDRVIWLNKGNVVREGPAEELVNLYTTAKANPELLDGQI
jgi:teichoic acid transport system ATP-binding protein